MIKDLVKNWWVFALQGALAIGVGVAAFVVPGVTLAAFIAVFAVYAIVSGVFGIVAGLSVSNGPRWSLVLGGIAGIAVGALTIAQPGNTALAVVLLVAIYVIATGVAQLGAAYTLGRLSNTFWLGLSGLVSVIFGVLLIAAPGDGVLAILWLIGFYAIFAGVMFIAFGFRLRGAGEDLSAFEAKVNQAVGAPSASSSASTSAAGTRSASTGSGS